MDFEIVTDSCCNLPGEMIDEFGLSILPMQFDIDGKVYQSYLKGQHVEIRQFYEMMREGKSITTSLPSLVDAERLFRELLDAGRDVLYIGFSSGLSSTYEAISGLMDTLAGEYPERKIMHVDTLAAAAGEGLLVWYAARMAQNGSPIEDVYQWLEYNKLHLCHWFTVDDLMYLFRGGRVSRTSAWAGTLLNIKPILHVDDEGHLIPMEKVRGRKKSLNAIIDHVRQTAIQPVEEQQFFLTHGDCLADAEYVAEELRRQLGVKHIRIIQLDPVIGSHSGPGTMAIFCMASQR